jgi:hypothetical protein
VATWVRSLDAQWAEARIRAGTAPPAPGAPLWAGDYRLTRGLAEIRFEDGAVITLEAPADVGLLDAGLARLTSGRLVAEVPPEAVGFTIQTPVGDIVDRGTGFGIEVDEDGETVVQVYEGEVAAKSKNRDAVASGHSGPPRRVWPLTALGISADTAAKPQQEPFEPWRFVRKLRDRGLSDTLVATTARASVDDNPDATSHVKAFLARIETSPAEAVQVGRVYEDCTEINDFTTAELRALIPAIIELLDDERILPPGAEPRAIVRQGVSDRAETVLEFTAGFRPEGEPRQQVWRDWWSGVGSNTRSAWLAERVGTAREQLAAWQAGAGYPANLHALNLLEIAVRSRDREVVPVFMDLLCEEMPAAHQTEVHLAAVVDAVGRLGNARLVPELVQLARRLNDEQKAVEPKGYSNDHARRSETLRSFASTLDRLAGTELASDALHAFGPAELGMCALDADAFPEWLEAAQARAGAQQQVSPSDLPKESVESGETP